MNSRHLNIDRKNILVNGEKVKRLQKILQVKSASEAVRVAVDRTIHVEEAMQALRRLKERGTWGTHLVE